MFWLLQAGGWIAFGAPMYAWALSYWSPVDALANKAALVALGFVLTLGMRAAYRRAAAFSAVTRRGTPVRRALPGVVIAVVSFVAATVWIESQALAFQLWMRFAHGEAIVGLLRFSIGTLLFHGFVLLSWSLLYHGLKAREDAESQRTRAEHAEARAQAERLRALQAQLNPHFLFNALNTISTLVEESRNGEAKAMIARLGTFLRLVLDRFDTPQIPLAEEIDLVNCYLEIERARFGARLQASVDVEPAALDALIPTLILQPLVENAVRHGILSRESGGSLEVRAAAHDGTLEIVVADDGEGGRGDATARAGTGLRNTAQRLQELHGSDAGVEFTPTPSGGVTRLRLPLRRAVAGDCTGVPA